MERCLSVPLKRMLSWKRKAGKVFIRLKCFANQLGNLHRVPLTQKNRSNAFEVTTAIGKLKNNWTRKTEFIGGRDGSLCFLP